MPESYADIENRKLQEALRKRQKCLDSNDYTCNICGIKFNRELLFTIPYTDNCYCQGCWVNGESQHWVFTGIQPYRKQGGQP